MTRDTALLDRVGNLGSPPAADPNQVTRVNEVEQARDDLHRSITQYRALLKEEKIPENLTSRERDVQVQIFSNLNKYAGELEHKNSGEGLMSLSITALNSILIMRDEINKLKFQNVALHKQIKELRDADIPITSKLGIAP